MSDNSHRGRQFQSPSPSSPSVRMDKFRFPDQQSGATGLYWRRGEEGTCFVPGTGTYIPPAQGGLHLGEGIAFQTGLGRRDVVQLPGFGHGGITQLPLSSGGFDQVPGLVPVLGPGVGRTDGSYWGRDGGNRSEEMRLEEKRERSFDGGRGISPGCSRASRPTSHSDETREWGDNDERPGEQRPCSVLNRPMSSRESLGYESLFGDKGVVDPWGNWQKTKEVRITDKKPQSRKRPSSWLGERSSSEEYSRERKNSRPGDWRGGDQIDTVEKVKTEQKRLIEKKKYEQSRLEDLKRREERVYREEKQLKELELGQQKIDLLKREEKMVKKMEEERLTKEKELFEREKKVKEKLETYRQKSPEEKEISTRSVTYRDCSLLQSPSGGEAVELLPSYTFKGVIVSVKAQFWHRHSFGFIRSSQVSCDVFVPVDHMDTEGENFKDLVYRTVLFSLEDTGGKCLEARNVRLVDKSVSPALLSGKIVAWDVRVGEGLVEVGKTGLRLNFFRLAWRRRMQNEALLGKKVQFELQVDRNLGVEARNVQLVKVFELSPSPSPAAADPCQLRGMSNNRSNSAGKETISRRSPRPKPKSPPVSSDQSILHRLGHKSSARSRIKPKKGVDKTNPYLSGRNKGGEDDDTEVNNNSIDRDVFTTVDQVGYTEVSCKEIVVKQAESNSVDLDKIVIKRRIKKEIA